METRLKIVVNAGLLFAFIGFVIYLMMIVVSFMGCCLGITQSIFNQILIILSVSGLVTFGICMYNTCFKSKKKNLQV